MAMGGSIFKGARCHAHDYPICSHNINPVLPMVNLDKVRINVGTQVRAQVDPEFRAWVGDQTWAQISNQVWGQVGAQVWNQVWGHALDSHHRYYKW